MKLHAVKIPSGGVWRLEMGTFAAMLLAKMQMPMIDNVHHLQDAGKGLTLLEASLLKITAYQVPMFMDLKHMETITLTFTKRLTTLKSTRYYFPPYTV